MRNIIKDFDRLFERLRAIETEISNIKTSLCGLLDEYKALEKNKEKEISERLRQEEMYRDYNKYHNK